MGVGLRRVPRGLRLGGVAGWGLRLMRVAGGIWSTGRSPSIICAESRNQHTPSDQRRTFATTAKRRGIGSWSMNQSSSRRSA